MLKSSVQLMATVSTSGVLAEEKRRLSVGEVRRSEKSADRRDRTEQRSKHARGDLRDEWAEAADGDHEEDRIEL